MKSGHFFHYSPAYLINFRFIRKMWKNIKQVVYINVGSIIEIVSETATIYSENTRENTHEFECDPK